MSSQGKKVQLWLQQVLTTRDDGLDGNYLFWRHIAEFDVLRSGHGGGTVVVHQFVERIELDDP